MLVTVLSQSSVAASGSQSGTIACKTLNGVYFKQSSASVSADITYTVTANGNTIANSIRHGSAIFLATQSGKSVNSNKMAYLDFGAIKVNGAIEITVENNEGTSATVDVLAKVDMNGGYGCTYAKYTGSTLSAKNVVLATLSGISTSLETSTDIVTIRSGNKTQSITEAESYLYGSVENSGAVDFSTHYGLVYKGGPAAFNLSGTDLAADQEYITKSVWRS